MKKSALVISLLIGLISYQECLPLEEPLKLNPFQNIAFSEDQPSINNWLVCFNDCNKTTSVSAHYIRNQNQIMMIEEAGKMNQSLYDLSFEENESGYIAHYNIQDNQPSLIKKVDYKVLDNNSLIDITVHSIGPFDLVFNLKNVLPEENIDGFGGLYNGTSLIGVSSQGVNSLTDLSKSKKQKPEWVGARSRFWIFLINSGNAENTTIDDADEDNLSLRIKVTPDNNVSKHHFKVYFGPVETSQIIKASPALSELMYSALWDWLRLICKAIEILLVWLLSIVGNPGLSILLLAVLVKFLLYPLTRLAEKWQAEVNKTQAWVQPRINEINRKFSGEEANTKILNLYSDNNISPFFTIKGLFGFLIQVPIFIAVFDVLGESIWLSGQSFLFVEDLSKPDHWLTLPFEVPFFGSHFNLLPLLMTIVTLVSAISYRDPYLVGDLLRAQRLKLYVMAAIFFILFFTFPSGMVLYWTTSNFIQLIKSLATKKGSLI